MFQTNDIPLSLYIHLPWCAKKCPYCDFNSHLLRDHHQFEDYTGALISQLRGWSELFKSRKIKTVYFGGGTPNLFPIDFIKILFREIRSIMDIEENSEISFEVNPLNMFRDSSIEEYFLDLNGLGVNRISVGAQSFDNMSLKRIGREHTPKEIELFLMDVCKIFKNVNVDLMYGLPGQNQMKVRKDIGTLKDFNVAHISYYQLTVEPGTMFYNNAPKLPSEDVIWDMYLLIMNELARNGYSRYEVSAFSKGGMRCQHNMNYWEFGDYIGLGAGAHSKITKNHLIERRIVISNPVSYVNKIKSNEQFFKKTSYLPGAEVLFEYMLNAGRLTKGFKILNLEERTGVEFASEQRKFCLACDKGLIEITSDKVIPTKLGLDFLNNLQEIFLPIKDD
ncbi:radical SAM family heme chaperone HemW [Betaproteobacteria bacterium]|nr:radical SAM family heme chaperone HemW [Betaproteobacteria bacterium]